MRNLKKVLALVLTLAMMLSVMVMNVGAFTDDKDIQHKEAAAVANAIEVLKGYEDGSYGPEKTLTRAEAATICARMLLTPDKANALKTSEAPFADVLADNWAAGYIAYCASEKIINGVGNDKFAPDDTLTVAQFCKIMLGALGYDAEREGMTGSAWSINTAKLAQKNDLLEDVDSAFDGDCNRDDAAQIILNTLVATLVEYDNDAVSITTGDGTQVNVSGKGAEQVKNNVNPATPGASENIKLDGYQQFAEEYFSDLELVDPSNNTDFGRPGTYTWKNDGDDVFTGSSDDDMVASFTGAASKGDLYKAIGKAAYNDLLDANKANAKLSVYVDGMQVGTTVKPANAAALNLYIQKDKTADATYSGNGVVTEVYVDGDNAVRLVFINTYLAQAKSDYNDSKETLDINVIDAYYTGAVATAVAANFNAIASTTLSIDDFDVSNFVKDDWLLVTIDNGDIATVEAADTVTGVVDSHVKGDSVTVDGTDYEYGMTIDTATKFPYAAATANPTYKIDSDLELILDANGYVLGYDASVGDDSYVFVQEIAKDGNYSKNATYKAIAYFTDGTCEEITVSELGGNKLAAADAKTYNQWFTYTTNSDGEYELTLVSTTVAATGVCQDAATLATAATAANNSTENNKAKFARAWDSTLATPDFVTKDFVSTKETVFIVVDEDDNVDVYTGYANVPTINKSHDTAVSIIPLIEDNYCEYVFIDAGAAKSGSTSSSSDFVFVFGTSKSGTDKDKNAYTSFADALLNGEEESVKATATLTAFKLYAEVEYDDNGYIDTVTEVTITSDEDTYMGFQIANTKAVTQSKDVITVDGTAYTLADDYVIYLFDSSVTGEYDDYTDAEDFVAEIAPSGTAAATYSAFCVLNDDEAITAMYVVK